ncbi:MAG: DNA primase [Candidatus Faecivicinus sp.]
MAGRLSDAWLDELRSRTSLEEIVSEYVPLKQKGRRFWGCCPFHNEKTPSFSVDSESQLYYCFGCHKGGTSIHFIMEMERLDFMDAVKLLAERAHMELPDRAGDSASRTNADERERIYEANTLAARFFHNLLWKEEGAEALNYLYKRGLNDSDIRRFGLGASPKGWDVLAKYLEGQGYSDALLEKAGLVVRRDGRVYDMFRGRAIFPIISAQGRVVGFGGRAMGDAQPKYLNTSETPVFNKRQGLYALNMAKKERGLGRLVLVEGYMDTVSLRKYGVQGVVATLGTALTEEQARLIKRFAPEVWISYDGDSAGRKAALRALDIFDAQEMRAKVIDYPAGMDPDDFVKANGQAGFDALPKYDATEYRMMRARDDLDVSTQEGMTQYAMRCCEILKRVKSPIEMENHLRRLVQETGYDREVLLGQIGVVKLPQTRPRTVRTGQDSRSAATDAVLAERALLTLLSSGSIPTEMVHSEDFSVGVMRTCAEWLIAGGSVNALIESLPDEDERQQAVQALNYEPLPEDREETLRLAETCLKTIRKSRLAERAAKIQEEIQHADPERKRALYEQMDAINREMDG